MEKMFLEGEVLQETWVYIDNNRGGLQVAME